MTSKTTTRPPTSAKGSYTQMFLDNENKHFIDAEKSLTYNEVLSWGGRKHSEFMMPFMNDDYTGMDYLYPPGITQIPGDPEDPDWRSQQEILDDAGYRFLCDIVCEIIQDECAAKDAVRCYYGAVTGDGVIANWEVIDDVGNNYWFYNSGDYVYLAPHIPWIDLVPYGDTGFNMEVMYTDVGSSQDALYYHPIMNQWITIVAGSSTCTADIKVRCCDSAPAISWDSDASADTIDYLVPASIHVDGGWAPFTWTISAAGYSLTHAETTVGDNTISVIDGICDTNFDPFAVITVTDVCGQSVYGGVRHVDGEWHNCIGRGWYGNCTDLGPGTDDDQIFRATGTYRTVVQCGSDDGYCSPSAWFTGDDCDNNGLFYGAGCPHIVGFTISRWIC